MNVGELIKELKEFPENMEITISDGFALNFYSLKGKTPEIRIFEGKVDIGVGGCAEEEEK